MVFCFDKLFLSPPLPRPNEDCLNQGKEIFLFARGFGDTGSQSCDPLLGADIVVVRLLLLAGDDPEEATAS